MQGSCKHTLTVVRVNSFCKACRLQGEVRARQADGSAICRPHSLQQRALPAQLVRPHALAFLPDRNMLLSCHDADAVSCCLCTVGSSRRHTGACDLPPLLSLYVVHIARPLCCKALSYADILTRVGTQ